MSKIIIIPTIFSSNYNVPSIYTGDPLTYALLNGGAAIPNNSQHSSSLFSSGNSSFTLNLDDAIVPNQQSSFNLFNTNNDFNQFLSGTAGAGVGSKSFETSTPIDGL